METNETKQGGVGKGFLVGVLAVIVHTALYFGIIIGLYFLAALLSQIPVLNGIVGLLFSWRGDSPGFVSPLIAIMIAYATSRAIVDKLNRQRKGEKTSLLVWGISTIMIGIWGTVMMALNVEQPLGFTVYYVAIIYVISGIVAAVQARG